MKLNDLKPNEGSTHRRKRLGIGISAGQGKTAGRGTKGQGARTGEKGKLYRQGGNLPFFRSLPFMRGEGFTPPNQVKYSEVNVGQLARFAANTEVTPQLLVEERLVKQAWRPVVILGKGEVTVPLRVRVHRVSMSARTKIEAVGGSIELVE